MMPDVDTNQEMETAPTRYFIRFGEVPDGRKSRMWKAPNLFLHDKIEQLLPGLSAYDTEWQDEKWVLNTDDINVDSGMSSLLECFAGAMSSPETNKVYLLRGAATSWKNMTARERKEFAEWHPGKGYEAFDILGTDGEPLVRNFEIVSVVSVEDLVCRMIAFPEDWVDGLGQIEEANESFDGQGFANAAGRFS
jgi:hypothetical protein